MARPTPAFPAGELVIEATGDGPELSDIPVKPFVYVPKVRHEGPTPVEQILGTLSSPRELLSLPDEALEPELGGAFPYVIVPSLVLGEE